MADQVIASLVGRLSFEVDQEGLRKFEAETAKARKGSDALGTQAVALGTTLGNLAAKAATAAVDIAKFAYESGKALAQDVAKSSVEIDRMAKRLGVTRQEIQELGGAASGTPKALEKLQEGLGELALRGSGPAKESLGALGLELEHLEGKGPADQLRVLADAMRDLPSDSERTKVALELLGEEGAALLPNLAQGSEGIDALIKRTRDLGVILDDEAIDAGKDYARAMGELDAVWARAAATGGTVLAPVFADLTRGAAEWLDANDEIIAQRLPEVIGEIVEAGQGLIHWGQELAGGIENITGLFTRMGDEGEAGLGGIVALGETAVEWSKAGIEAFVEWTDDIAEMADLVWDVAGAVEDGLVTAWEYVEPVVDSVGQAIDEQTAKLGPVVDFVESLVDRVLHLRDLVADVVEDVGLGSAFSAEDLAAIEDARAIQRSPAAAQIQAAEEERAYQERVIEHTERLIGEAKEAEASKGRRKRAEAYRRKAMGGGKGRVDVSAAEQALGPEIRALAQAAGASDAAIRQALEAAAGELKGGASTSVARQAAAGVLTQKTGVDLSAQGGSEAAVFQRLTQIGGAEAARAATDGARFIRIDQSQNNTITVNVPESWGSVMTVEGAAQDFATAVRSILSDDYRQIIERGETSVSP